MEGIIGAIISVVCVIIGLLWNEVSRWFAGRREKRQTLNKTISLLLELYFQIRRISNSLQQSQSYIEWYLAQFKENSFSQEDKEMIRNALTRTLNPLVTEMASYDMNKISTDYDNILKDLSCYYPVNAYRLRGRNDIKSILTNIDIFYDSIKQQVPISYDEYNEIISLIKPIIQTQAFENHLSAIKDEIDTLSQDVGIHQRKEIQKTLANIGADDSSYQEAFENIKTTLKSILKERLPHIVI